MFKLDAMREAAFIEQRQVAVSVVLPHSSNYAEITPSDQILSNQINNLIVYFGRDKVAAMCEIVFPNNNKESV